MTDDRDEIRRRIDIVDLVGQRVILKRVGKHFSGLCPFHNDKNPSFTVDPTTGRYRCWSCNESGDVFTWVMKTENLDFPEALENLAGRAGVVLSGRDKSSQSSKDRSQLYAAMQEALNLFQESLKDDKVALDYCQRRGLTPAVIAKWKIGFSPRNGEALTVRLKRLGIPLAICKELFLVEEDGRGGYYDRFRGRLMFPILNEKSGSDTKSNLVAFGGRLLGDGHPKYINSSDTPLYRKSNVLYGMNLARPSLMASKTAVLVEGYLDVISCHEGGVESAVASLGTALGEEHCRLLKRWAEQVTILYDSDAAGQKASERAITLLEAEGLRVKIALMPEGQDPDTLLKEQGPPGLQKAVKSAVSPTSFKLLQLDRRLTVESDQYWDEAVNILGSARENLEREGHLLRLAGTYPHIKDVRTALARLTKMVDEVRKPKPRNVQSPKRVAAPEFVPLGEPLISAEKVIFGALHEVSFQKAAWVAINSQDVFVTSAAGVLAQAVMAAFPTGPPDGPPINWIYRVEPEAARQLLSDIHLDYQNSNLNEQEIMDSVQSLRTMAIKRDLLRLRQGNLNSDERQEILLRIKLLNPDTKVASTEDDDDPFS